MKRGRRAKWEGRLHLGMAGVWALLCVPTILWWADSILWVLIISLYANFVGHLGAAKAAQAEESAEKE